MIIDLYASGPGWQGGMDESWAIDNLSISIYGTPSTPVPTTPAWLLILLGIPWLIRINETES